MSITLVGNKLDLVEQNESLRKVDAEEALALCRETENMRYIETSALAGSNVNNAF